MPTWLIVVIVVVAVLPGAAVILIGVLSLFLSTPPHDPLLGPTDHDAGQDADNR